MRVTNLRTGDVYRLKEGSAVVLAQVGEGGDVGFVRARSIADLTEGALLFRVIMNEPNFRRNWSREALSALHPALWELARYGDADIGSDAKFSVRIDEIAARSVVDDATFDSLEPLAVWETSHVLRRLGEN